MSQPLIETLPAKPTPKIEEAIDRNPSSHGFGSVQPIPAMAIPVDPAPLYVFGDSLSDISAMFFLIVSSFSKAAAYVTLG